MRTLNRRSSGAVAIESSRSFWAWTLIPWPRGDAISLVARSTESAFGKRAVGANAWRKNAADHQEIERLMEHDTAGDPISGLKWSRRTTEKIAKALCKDGIQVG